ncbi:hypothetical protein BJX76DRAFT_24489 [Aspergillus varians]
MAVISTPIPIAALPPPSRSSSLRSCFRRRSQTAQRMANMRMRPRGMPTPSAMASAGVICFSFSCSSSLEWPCAAERPATFGRAVPCGMLKGREPSLQDTSLSLSSSSSSLSSSSSSSSSSLSLSVSIVTPPQQYSGESLSKPTFTSGTLPLRLWSAGLPVSHAIPPFGWMDGWMDTYNTVRSISPPSWYPCSFRAREPSPGRLAGSTARWTCKCRLRGSSLRQSRSRRGRGLMLRCRRGGSMLTLCCCCVCCQRGRRKRGMLR